jgi:hypothetical protein
LDKASHSHIAIRNHHDRCFLKPIGPTPATVYHERRASGRKSGSPALVLRGSARVIAAVATRQRAFTADDLAQADRAEWERLRQTLDERRQRRAQRRRFRRDPGAYLRQLEDLLI